MKVIIYSSNTFQSILCLQTIEAWMASTERPKTSSYLGGKITLKTNKSSVTAVYEHGRDTIINFSNPKKVEDKNQLKLKL